MADAVKKGAEAVKDKVSGNGSLLNSSVSHACLWWNRLEVASGAGFEAHKAAAKDSDRSIGDRVGHGEWPMACLLGCYHSLSLSLFLGVDAVKDKLDEKKSEASKEVNKNAAENEAKSLVDTVKEKAAEAYVDRLTFPARSSPWEFCVQLQLRRWRRRRRRCQRFWLKLSKRKQPERMYKSWPSYDTGCFSFSYNYVAEKVSEATHAVTGEANKEVAKDSSQSVGTRAGAAVDAAKDKVNEKASEVKAEAHKQNLWKSIQSSSISEETSTTVVDLFFLNIC